MLEIYFGFICINAVIRCYQNLIKYRSVDKELHAPHLFPTSLPIFSVLFVPCSKVQHYHGFSNPQFNRFALLAMCLHLMV